jgi:hypothetical protein
MKQARITIMLGLLGGVFPACYSSGNHEADTAVDGPADPDAADGRDTEAADGVDWTDGMGERCTADFDCPASMYCDPCGGSSCPACTDCVPLCRPHGCATEPEPLCNMVRPQCGEGATSVVRDGCWICVDRATCEQVPWHDPRCDDGTEPACPMVPPTCAEHEILAYQGGCFACVNPATCRPWGEPGCEGDASCAPEDWCDGCGSSSCPMCDDCVAACVPHGCPTEPEAFCEMVRPECGEEGVAVARDGCWICVDLETCEAVPGHDPRCDDGTTPSCGMIPPTCAADEILAYQDDCYVCVNPATCMPWGVPGCEADADCAAEDWCDPCGSSSCPMCEDCIAACAPHGCPTEPEAACDMVRPGCGEEGVAVVRDGCWICVTLGTCEPFER